MRRSDWRDLILETMTALALHWRRTAFVIGGAAVGVGLFVALSGLSSAGAAALASSLQSAEGVLVVARPAGGASDVELFEGFTPEDAGNVAGVESGEVVRIGSPTLITDAIHADGSSSAHEATLLAASSNFLDDEVAWPALDDEIVISSSLADRLSSTPIVPPFGVVVGGFPVTVVDTVVIPESLGVSADVAIARPESHLFQAQQTVDYRVATLASAGRVDDVARSLPYALSPAQPERVAVLTSLPSASAQDAVAEQASSWMNAVAWLGLLVAACSIGLPLVMAVSERKPEIGLRRAIGYPEVAINVQFTLEGLIAATTGGVLGAGIGSVAQIAVSMVNGWPPTTDALATLLGVGVASIIGVVAGAASAAAAARVSPLDSLRPGL